MAPVNEALERVRAERDWLRGLLVARTTHFPAMWRLTGLESRIMGRLVDGLASTADLLEAAYWDTVEPESSVKIIEVTIWRMRRKLQRFRIEIKNNYGIGYFLAPNGKELVLRELRANRH